MKEASQHNPSYSMARVLIIIVTWNKKDYVSRLLESLKYIDYADYSIAVIDNASTDGTTEHIRENFPDVEVIRNAENLGGSGGFNTGLSYAFGQQGYKYLWLLDNDVEVSGGALRALVDVLERRPEMAVAGSMMCQLDNKTVTNELGAYVDLHNGRLVLHRHLTRCRNNSTGVFSVDYVAAASMLVRFDAAKKAGLWKDFFIHFDDVDWCLRIRKMGYGVSAVADSVIWHLSAVEKPITWVQYYDVRNMLYLLKEHSSPSDVSRFGRRKCLQAVYLELKGLASQPGVILDGVEDFLCGIKGKREISFPLKDIKEVKGLLHGRRTVVHQNEWFDLRKFPFDGTVDISDVLLPYYLADAFYYWDRNAIFRQKKWLWRLRGILGLMGFKIYDIAFEDIRNLSFILGLISREKVIRVDESSYLTADMGALRFLKRLTGTAVRAIKYYLRFVFRRF